jgi:hypothetical protein
MRWAVAGLLMVLAMPAAASPREAAQQALECARGAEAAALAGCVAPLARGFATPLARGFATPLARGFATPLAREAAACLLRGDGRGACLGLREAGLVGLCALGEGGVSAESLAACVALRLAMREAAKCLSVGVGVPGGCLGPGNTLRQWGEAGWAAWQGRDEMIARLPAW